ncbi:hypothetical protein [Streptomyces sp. NPDC051577]|uniref:hypothetical protein n=1 Tax=Streptomyces sp. NPDC051577 TaxID=3155166 RepID=UPI00343FE291
MSPLASWTRRHRRAARLLRVTLSVVLLGLVTFEGVVLARQPSAPHAAVWVSGILVCLSAAPWPRVPLLARAWFAAATTWTVTLLLILGNHPLVVWGAGEAIALLVLLSQVLLRAPARTAAALGPLLGLGCRGRSVPGRGAFTYASSVGSALIDRTLFLSRD